MPKLFSSQVLFSIMLLSDTTFIPAFGGCLALTQLNPFISQLSAVILIAFPLRCASIVGSPSPMSESGLFTTTFSKYVPLRTMRVSPTDAAFIAPWIEG